MLDQHALAFSLTCKSVAPTAHTSLRVTGFSSRVRCVSRGKLRKGSKSASSARLFEVRTRVVRFGIELARVLCMLLTRLRARRSVCNRGESGKLEMAVMSLSVKSIDSWSYSHKHSWKGGRSEHERCRPSQRPDSQYWVSCGLQVSIMISMELALQSVVSALFSPNAPRRSSSRSLRGFRYEREFWMSSAVSLMAAETNGTSPARRPKGPNEG